MGRSIVRNPQAFLFDEPLSNLDAKLRVQMRTQIKKLHQRMKTTVVYVTHDQIEAMTLADRIVVMNAGRIEQVASPQEMYDHPGDQVRRRLHRLSGDEYDPLHGRATGHPSGDSAQRAPQTGYSGRPDRALCTLCWQADAVRHPAGAHHREARPRERGAARLHRQVQVLEPMGVDTMVFLEINGEEICARAAPHSVRPVGQLMEFTVDMSKMHLIDPKTDKVV